MTSRLFIQYTSCFILVIFINYTIFTKNLKPSLEPQYENCIN